jgi:dTDP-4-dehydrorhamnose reductase
MKVLITGASGQVGRALLDILPSKVEVRALTRGQLDVSDPNAVDIAVASFRPQVIINAAAYTAVDQAESEPEIAGPINAFGPRNLAQSAHAIPGCRLLHISTDYVFDGRGIGPYRPQDDTNPLSVYGRTKLFGERAALTVLGDRAVVLRTAWVYASQGKNFLLTMLRLMREQGAVSVVDDQHGTPTTAISIANALWVIARRPAIHGILHWTDGGEASWKDFAQAIAEEGRAAGLLSAPVHVTPIATADYPTAAPRPANSVLDSEESIRRLRISPLHWRAALRATLAQMQAA